MFSANINKILKMTNTESECFKKVAESVINKLHTEDKLFAIIGGGVDSIKLAYSLMQYRKKILFVDADTDTDVFVSKYKLGKNLAGFADYISGDLKVEEESRCATNIEGFDIVFTGNCDFLEYTDETNTRIKEYLEKKAQEYDLVVVLSDEEGEAASKCDATVVMIDKEQYGEVSSQVRVKNLDEKGCLVLGVIINE